MTLSYTILHPRVKEKMNSENIAFHPTELAKKLFEASPPGQGMVGFVDLLTGEIHLCPLYNKGDEKERLPIEVDGLNYAVESDESLRDEFNTPKPGGGTAHKNAMSRLNKNAGRLVVGLDSEHSGNLLAFGLRKGTNESILDTFRNRSASLNLMSIKYDDEYLRINKLESPALYRSIPQDISLKIQQTLCEELPLNENIPNQKRNINHSRGITPIKYTEDEFREMQTWHPLHYAAETDQVEAINQLLSTEKPSIDIIDTAGLTPLMRAVTNKHLRIVEILIAANASVDLTDLEGQTALMRAVANNDPIIVEKLINAGASVNIAYKNQQTPLMLAIANNQLEIVAMLLENSPLLDLRDREGKTVLMRAVENNKLDIVAMLLDKGPSLDLCDGEGKTALMRAIENNQLEMVTALLNAGASVNLPYPSGETPLMRAIANNNFEIVEALINKGASVNLANAGGQTPLMRAVENNQLNIVNILIKNGAKVDVLHDADQSPLMRAIENNQLKIVMALLEAGAPVNLPYQSDQTPLMHAIAKNNFEIVAALVDKGAEVNQADATGQTPLMRAIINSNSKIVELLINKGALANMADASGKTPIICALEHYNSSVIKILCKQQINLDTLTQLAIDVADPRYDKFDKAEEIINNATDDQIDKLNLILKLAIKADHIELVEKLVKKGALPDEASIKFVKLMENVNMINALRLVKSPLEKEPPSQNQIINNNIIEHQAIMKVSLQEQRNQIPDSSNEKAPSSQV